MVKLKRAYEAATDDDGKRILVDRIWPRGISKERAQLDRWAKDIAPSAELCKWFNHDPVKWGEFTRRYKEELDSRHGQLKALAHEAKQGTLTLVYGARDEEHNQALVLKEALETIDA